MTADSVSDRFRSAFSTARKRLEPYLEFHRADVFVTRSLENLRTIRFDDAVTTVVEDPDHPILERAYADQELARIRSGIAEGHVAVVLTVDDEVLARGALAFSDFRDPYSGVAIRLKPRESYLYDIKVVEARRGGRLGPFMLTFIQRLALERSDALFTVTNVDNTVAQRVLRRVNAWSEDGSVSYVVVRQRWGLQIPFSGRTSSGVIPRFG